MAGDKTVVARAQEQERDIILKAEEALQRDSSSTPSLNGSSTFSTPRASSVATPKGSAKATSRAAAAPAPRKYVSPMAKAREDRKRRAAEAASEASKDWPNLSDMETSSTPSSGSMNSDASAAVKATNLPKFGEWEKHSANSGPCYTVLFQHAAQEKKTGGPVPVRTDSETPQRTQDLYQAAPPPPECKSLKRKQFAFLCCFSS